MKRTLFTLAGLALTGLVHASDPILERQELMENMKDEALKPLVGMTRGEVPFDAEVVSASLAIMREVAARAPALFPEGSESGHDTEARATIWEDRAGFDEKMTGFDAAVEAAQAAAPASVEQLQPVLKTILDSCKACHDDYRVEKD